jgi:hypothetical protein
MPGLIEAFADAESTYRRERISAEFRRTRIQPRRWLAGVFSPAKRRAGRPTVPGPAMPAPHHLHAAS